MIKLHQRISSAFKQVEECCWRAVSANVGPKVTILGGVHGNELSGIKVIESLLTSYSAPKRGSLTLAIGNPKAVELGTRGSTPHSDLNRSFSKAVLTNTSNNSYEALRARTLSPYLKDSDVLLDLHATNKPSRPFTRIAGTINAMHHSILRWLPADILLTDPKYKLAGDICTTDEYVGLHGGVGICFESGLASDVSTVQQLEQSVKHILSTELGMFPVAENAPLSSSLSPCNEIYELQEVIILAENEFEWSNGHGTMNFENIQQGEIFGVYGSGKVLKAPFDSYLVFPKVPNLWRVGGPIGWLAKRL